MTAAPARSPFALRYRTDPAFRARKLELQASVTEPQFSTTGPHGELFIALAAWMAKQERARLQERIRAGISRARAEGKQLGRRAVIFDIDKARELRAAGQSWRAIGKALEQPATTIMRRLKP